MIYLRTSYKSTLAHAKENKEDKSERGGKRERRRGWEEERGRQRGEDLEIERERKRERGKRYSVKQKERRGEKYDGTKLIYEQMF
jgi:hypothetical protein